VALLLGSEAEGLPPQVLAAADARVTIPMAPGIDSLNAATAAGIALHRFARALGRLAGTS
jgi:tRNA G18 (ribose-2'-O)-methylase SpoU